MQVPVYRGDAHGDLEPWAEVVQARTLVIARDADTPEGRKVFPASADLSCFAFVIAGEALATGANGRFTMRRGDWAVVPDSGLSLLPVIAYQHGAPPEVMIVDGTWDEISDINMFLIGAGREIETHFHDFHEYWILYRGGGQAESEGVTFTLRPGDVLATHAGLEHGMAAPDEITEGVTVETRPRGRGRLGHLHRGVDGTPVALTEP